MSDFRVVVTDQVFPSVEVERQMIEAAGGSFEVASGTREEVLAIAHDADALLNTYFAFDGDSLRSLSRCKIVARYGIGVDNVDLDAAKAAGIAVTNVPDYCVEEVATHTVAMMLSLIRRLPEGDALVRGGGWGAAKVGEMRRVSELTVGLLGYGRIAHNVAKVLSALGASIVVHDPYVKSVQDGERLIASRDEFFATADVFSVHCPLTPETRGLINAATIALMKPTALVVNTSRGPVVNFTDLAAALRDGRLAGAALDVLDPEPPPPGLIDGVPHLLVTPHSAFSSREAVRESQTKAATQVLKALAGEPLDYRIVCS